MSHRRTDIEFRYRWLSLLAVLLFSGAFALGLVVHVAAPESRLASAILNVGLVTLIATPGVRLLVALAERIRTRDRTFLLMMVAVVAELVYVLWRAGAKS